MANIFTRRLRAARGASGIADVLSPAQVRTFSDCEVRWFYQHLLGLSDPLTSVLALDTAIRTALLTNFRHKLESKQDIETEGVVGLFRRTWEQQQTSAMFCKDEVPETIRRTGEELVRIYMQQAAPQIRPASIKQPFQGVLGMVRILGQLDVMDEDGAIIDIRTVRTAAARIDHGVRFELATCARLAEGASGVVPVRIVRHSQRKRGATDRPDLRSNGASPRPYQVCKSCSHSELRAFWKSSTNQAGSRLRGWLEAILPVRAVVFRRNPAPVLASRTCR